MYALIDHQIFGICVGHANWTEVVSSKYHEESFTVPDMIQLEQLESYGAAAD